MISIFTSVTLLSGLVERLVEALFGGIAFPSKYNELIMRVLAVGVALLITFGFRIDYSSEILGALPVMSWIGYLFTGILVGTGSSVVHDILEKYGRK